MVTTVTSYTNSRNRAYPEDGYDGVVRVSSGGYYGTGVFTLRWPGGIDGSALVQQWIDQSLRAQYPNAPTNPEQVQKAVIEGSSGTGYSYFLLQFIGVRSDPAQMLSVDYATRDGTATAGQDYLGANKGTLVLYPNENQSVIPVEIIGDTVPEPDETLYLDVFNPVGGGSFDAGVVTLTAVRTIVNDDAWG